jgi:hypothetical protein
VLQHRFQYSSIWSCMMYVDLEGWDSLLDTRVSLINAGMGPRLVKYCWMLLYPTVCRGRRQVVTALSVLRNPLCSDRREEVHKVAELAGGSSPSHVRFFR